MQRYGEVVLVISTRPKHQRRTRSGCFNCRKIKKKCDELRPICSCCITKCIPCVWPTGNESLPKGYKIPPVDQHMVRQKEERREIAADETQLDFVHVANTKDIEKVVAMDQFDKNEPYVMTLTTRDLKDCPECPVELNNERLPLWIPISESMTETFITVGAVGFISALAPQYTHPLLKTEATWTPMVTRHEIMLKVAEACGCAFLTWKKPDLDPLAEETYISAMAALMEYMDTSILGEDDHTWIGAACQLMSVGAKRIWNFKSEYSINSLRGSYKLIKMKLQELDLIKDSSSPQKPTIFDESSTVVDYNGDNIRMELENSIVCSFDVSLSSRFERGFLESFIYNYGMCLLLHDDSVLGIPNPFETFVYLRQMLKHPLLQCEVAWMNHPVFGSSFDAFEMAIKASYLFKHLNHPKTRSAAEHLLETAVNYSKPTIPAEVHRNPEKFTQLHDSVLLTEAILGGVKLLLRKVMHPDISPNDELTQKDVGAAARRLRRISVRSEVRAISPWCLLILGLVCIEDDDRSIVIDAIFQYSDMVHARYMYSVIDVLEIGWGLRGDSVTMSRGLDVLLDQNILEILVL